MGCFSLQHDGELRAGLHVQYEVRKPLIANLDVVGKFNTSEALTNASRE